MNRLPIEKRAQIIGLLVEGMSMRAVTRVTGVSINTVTKLLEDVGLAAGLYQAQTLVNLPCKRVECDEIWAFCYAKEKNVAPADKGVLGFGDVYTWTALCADTKLMISYLVGQRTLQDAESFICDLEQRLASRIAFNRPRMGTANTSLRSLWRSAVAWTTQCWSSNTVARKP